MLRRKVKREGENRGENKKDEERKKEGEREEERTRWRGKTLKKKILNVQVVINQKKKCSVSENDKKWTDTVNRSPVKGAPCAGDLTGSDIHAHCLHTIPHANEFKGTSNSHSFGLTDSIHKVTQLAGPSLCLTKVCWGQELSVNTETHILTSRHGKLKL